MADTLAKANARYERNYKKYGTGSAPATKSEKRRAAVQRYAYANRPGRKATRSGGKASRGGSIARGTSSYSKGSQFKIAQAAAGKTRGRMLSLNKRTGIYESSEGRR